MMSFKTIKWLVLIFGVAVVLLLVWPTLRKIREDNIQFGKNFNHVRDSLGVPIIEEDWIISESNPYDRFWKSSDAFGKSNLPIHESKISYIRDNDIVSEEDDFFYDMADSLAYRLILRYEFKKSVWDCEVVEIRKLEKRPAKYWPVTPAQADSILRKWRLSR